ncbi:MAG: GNAT family N-acetyltransferase [Halobacteriovoraceae bacterium]|jgi:RimJ/RimL family protein N-acetyltransferase/ADP-ribose pyrophosphatase YjhB (NUDIX family)|nr:GNAT family N-acetyltransferase [Halobacteriovoraceae bacterium]
MISRDKVLAYIIRINNGVRELLVFDHRDQPEVNPQVPGGTVDSGESFDCAVLREVFEESGLEFHHTDLYLGQFDYMLQKKNQLHKRGVYLLKSNEARSQWMHIVSAGEEDKGMKFDYYWLPIEDARDRLMGGMGEYLPRYFYDELKETDLPIIERWLQNPHVKEFWDDGESWEESYEKYVLKTLSKTVKQFLIYCQDRPIGYIQFYWASKVGDGWWEDIADDVVGIDQYIGEADMIGQGHGTKMISEFIKLLICNYKISKIITDPVPSNTRAIACYEKCGFKQVGEIETPDGIEMLMEYKVL